MTEELSYALVHMLEAVRLEIRAAALIQRGDADLPQAMQLQFDADRHAHDGIAAGTAPLNKKEG